MLKTFHVAVRELLATVLTKAFLLAVVLPPGLMVIVFTLMPILMNQAAPKVAGKIAVVDKSGAVVGRLGDAFTAEKMNARRNERAKQKMDAAAEKMPMGQDQKKAAEMMAAAAGQTSLTLEKMEPGTDLEAEKAKLAKANAKNSSVSGETPLLALVVIPPEAVKAEPGKLAGFDLFVAPKLDVEVQGDIEEQISKAIVDARLEANSLQIERIRELMNKPRAAARTVTAEGERKTNEAAAILVPGAFLFLLWVSVFSAGQYLLTSTIEEKSNRVMEVLLSAVSPMQLMVGKILGQMAVGILILGAYTGVGMIGLAYAAMQHLIDPMNIVYLAIYFMIAFFLIACLMASIGSAVSDVREAQSLLGPVMIVLIIPMLLWMPILRNPNSTFAQVVSFIPPVSPFVMVLRLAGSEPIPFWQVPSTMAVGLASVVVAAWAAAKIFRIGVLMYGKPPNFATLIKWIRMA